MKNLLRYWVLSLACVSVLGACNDDDVVREPDGEAVLSIENAPAKASLNVARLGHGGWRPKMWRRSEFRSPGMDGRLRRDGTDRHGTCRGE